MHSLDNLVIGYCAAPHEEELEEGNTRSTKIDPIGDPDPEKRNKASKRFKCGVDEKPEECEIYESTWDPKDIGLYPEWEADCASPQGPDKCGWP